MAMALCNIYCRSITWHLYKPWRSSFQVPMCSVRNVTESVCVYTCNVNLFRWSLSLGEWRFSFQLVM
uniref:Uncharacterized protein n=1 Tax=Aegilops tauschii subsp. strangulata TaxID=200361 RepID=A0A453F6X1_AEGTS